MLTVLLVVFVILLISGFPIIVALGIPSIIYAVINELPSAQISYSMFKALNSFPLVAGPLFILMGNLVNDFGETKRIYRFAELLLRKTRGYSAKVNILVSLIFSGMSGAAVADIGGLGQIEIRAMEDEGFSTEYSTALTSASAMVGPIFPPSIPLIIYAVNAEVSTLRVLLAGVVPAILITIVLYLFVINQIPRKLKNQLPVDRHDHDPPEHESLLKSTLDALPMIVLVPIIIAIMLLGISSPSEAAAAAVLYIIILEILRGTFSLKTLKTSLVNTYKVVASIFIIIAVASFFSSILTLERFPEAVAAWFMSISQSPVVILLLLNIMVLFVGMFMETVSSLIILTPILFTITRTIDMDPLHLGVVLVFNLTIGMLTPPFGVGVYTVARIGNIAPDKVFRELFSLYWPLIIALLLITFIPQLSLWLPSLY